MYNTEFMLSFRRECESILQNPTPAGLQKLSKSFENVTDTETQYFQNMVLTGLMLLLKKLEGTNRNDIKIEAVKTMTAFIKKIRISVLDTYKTIVAKCLQQIFIFDKAQLHPETPEELKLCCLNCIEMASKRLTTDCIEEFFNSSDASGVTVMTQLCCVLVIEHEKYRKLRIAAVNCMLALLQLHDSAEFDDVTLRYDIAASTFKTLPKNVSTFRNVIIGDPNQGVEVIAIVVKALGRLVCLIMEDYNKEVVELDTEISKLFQTVDLDNSSNNDDVTILGLEIPKIKDTKARQDFYLQLQYTKEWRIAASRQLIPLFDSLAVLKCHQSERVRMELATMCINLLERCSINMTPCLPQIVTFLIGLSVDECDAIANNVNKSLKKNITSRIDPIFWDKMEEQFIRHLVRLPRVIYTEDESQQLSSFLFLKGFINMVPENRLKIIFSNNDTVNKFNVGFLAAVELERNDDILVNELAIRSFEDEPVARRPWKQFKHIRSQKLINVLGYICKSLGNSCVGQMLVSNFIDIMNTNDSNCNEAVVLLMQLSKLNANCGTIVLNELVEEWHWNLAIQADLSPSKETVGNSAWFKDRTEGLYESAFEFRYTDLCYTPNESATQNMDVVTINDAKTNVLHICLVLEAIGTISQTLGNKMEQFLFKLLHKLLEMAGGSNNALHLAGVFAVHQIVGALELEGPHELINRNSDYVAYHVNKAIKKADSNSKALDIIGTVLKFSSMESILNLENIITTILEENSKVLQMNNTAAFLRTFNTILISLKCWIIEKTDSIEKQIPIQDSFEVPVDPYERWINVLESNDSLYDMEMQSVELNDNGSLLDKEPIPNNENHLSPPEDESEENTQLPKYIQITIDILNRCVKYLSSNDDAQKLVVLEAIENGVEILRDYEDQLLPLTHTMWQPLCERFLDNNPIILSKSYSLLVVLARLTKEFIYKRTVSDVLPKLFKFLKASHSESARKEMDVSYKCSQIFKLQKKVLSTLGELLLHLDISPKILDDALESSIGFLHKDQPNELKRAGVRLFLELANFDKSAVYIKVYGMHSQDFEDAANTILDAIDNRRRK